MKPRRKAQRIKARKMGVREPNYGLRTDCKGARS